MVYQVPPRPGTVLRYYLHYLIWILMAAIWGWCNEDCHSVNEEKVRLKEVKCYREADFSRITHWKWNSLFYQRAGRLANHYVGPLNWQGTPVFFLRNPMHRGACGATGHSCLKESDLIEATNTHTQLGLMMAFDQGLKGCLKYKHKDSLYFLHLVTKEVMHKCDQNNIFLIPA